MKKIGAKKEDILAYAFDAYGTEAEYLWAAAPNDAILRNDNGKWYAVLMTVGKEKLGFDADGTVDIAVVKCDPIERGLYLEERGFLPAYHMNRNRWITVLLDGSVSKESVFAAIARSRDLTKFKN